MRPSGPVKGDWIIHDGRLVILELAARLSGGFLSTHGHPLAKASNVTLPNVSTSLG
jgi:hypothetical protein